MEKIVYEQKCYLAVTVCSQARAVNIEIMENRTTDQLLLALKRFFARRGIPKVIHTDGALEMSRTSKEILRLFDVLIEVESQNLFTARNNLENCATASPRDAGSC